VLRGDHAQVYTFRQPGTSRVGNGSVGTGSGNGARRSVGHRPHHPREELLGRNAVTAGSGKARLVVRVSIPRRSGRSRSLRDARCRLACRQIADCHALSYRCFARHPVCRARESGTAGDGVAVLPAARGQLERPTPPVSSLVVAHCHNGSTRAGRAPDDRELERPELDIGQRPTCLKQPSGISRRLGRGGQDRPSVWVRRWSRTWRIRDSFCSFHIAELSRGVSAVGPIWSAFRDSKASGSRAGAVWSIVAEPALN